MSRKAERLLLCRPAGGLNDMLCQIERCRRYAERFDRTVVVETDHPHGIEFASPLDNYFESLDRRLVVGAHRHRHRFDSLDVHPAWLAGRVTTVRTRNAGRVQRTVDAETGLRLSFDFWRDHEAPLLVHHDYGGGRLSLDALARLRLSPALTKELRRRLGALPRRYSALHIRDSDYRTRYLERLGPLAASLTGPVFVATDNAAALEACRAAFGPLRTYSFADLAGAIGSPLHRSHVIDPRRRNVDSILDLLMLAAAERVHGFPLELNEVGTVWSGYTLLALGLHADRRILHRLTGGRARRRADGGPRRRLQ